MVYLWVELDFLAVLVVRECCVQEWCQIQDLLCLKTKRERYQLTLAHQICQVHQIRYKYVKYSQIDILEETS